ncbi:MAG: asparagine synthase (glutamine-hydrolyzing) [Gammaproteobacteria bacterium]|nr:asparagine synthase (glutamine-hydrolyzing) [Gammaproteobacteria bacterium]
MCGLTGVLNIFPARRVEETDIQQMVGMLHHRGPDGTGIYIDEYIGLGHARLSIIDLEGGKQPIHNEDSTVWVVFNGEIFNYVELRENLIQKGHIFYTHTDTEVIVHLYEEYGDEFVQHLNGQFAIALWDKNPRKLILVRDRIGILPLFYARKEGQLLFASEVKAILPLWESSPELNPHALDQLMTFWSPVSPETVFKGVYEVSPGELIVIENGQISKKRYWDWSFPQNNSYRAGTESQLAAELHDLLVDATQIRLRSDVPVGAYLSGGLDSSVLVSIIHHYSNAPLRTFSIGFEDDAYDEGNYQNLLIEHLGTEHSRIQCKNHQISEAFLNTIWHTESPILRTAPVPMRLLSGLVHEKDYKVVLTGEGSDEVLGGYDIFKEGKIRQFWARNAESSFRPLLLKKLYPYLDLTKGHAYLKNFFGIELDKPESPFFAHFPRWNTTAKIKEFLSGGIKSQLRNDALETMEKSLPAAINQWHSFNKAQYIEAKSLMAGYLLCSQGDRMLMANSVEGRFPFLDHRVIEFANSIHPKFKMKALNEKYLLKKAFQKYLPGEIVKRYKQPYRAPDIPVFFGGNTPAFVNELLDKQKLRDYGYFEASKVERLIKKIQAGRAIGYKENMALIGILSTQVWHYHFIENYRRNYSQ